MKRTSKKNIQIPEKKDNRQKTETKIVETSFLQKNLKYLFLALILFYIGTSLYQEFYGNEIFSFLQQIFQIPTIIIGILSLYFDRQKLIDTVNQLFKSDNEPFIEKVKLFFSKKEILTTSLFVIVLGVSVFTLFHKLDNFDVFSDEIQVTKGAAGYYHTGEFRQWDFIKETLVGKPYTVAKPHLRVVALSYKIFGVNAFAARFPSALFGVFLIAFLYLIGRYFIKDKYAALLTAFAFALYFEFLFLGRWARMYGILYPMFFLIFYWTFKLLTEKNNLKIFNSGKNNFPEKYFNFNYIYLPFIAVLFYIALNTHTNVSVIFLIFLIFLFPGIVIFRTEKRYLTAFLFAFTILILQLIFPFKVNFKDFTFFEIDNSPIYNKAFFDYPFSVKTNIILLFVSFSALFFSKNKDFQKRYLILFITVTVPWLFFSYIIKYAPNYRYVSFLTPFAVLLIVGSFMLINKILFHKTIQIFLVLLLVASVGLSYSNHYEGLYVKNVFFPASPSEAQKTLVKNIHESDVIFKHWGPKMYLKGIPKETEILSLGTYKGRNFSDIFKDMNRKTHGWLVWDKQHEARLDQNFVAYCNLYFKKYAGYGIDNYGEEIYYYNKKMLQPLELFAYQQYFPAANLNLKNSYSFVFDLKTNEQTNGSILYIRKDSIIEINCFIRNKNLILKTSETDSVYIMIPENQKNTVFWTFSPQKTTLFLNGEKLTEKNISLKPNLVKFMINPQFNGYFNNIRLYDFALNNNQIKVIAKDENISEELEADNQIFRTLFLWKKK